MTEAGHHPTTCVSNRRAGCLAGTLHTATRIRRDCCLDVEVYHYESQLNDIALRCPGRVLAAPVQRVREGWDSEAHILTRCQADPQLLITAGSDCLTAGQSRRLRTKRS